MALPATLVVPAEMTISTSIAICIVILTTTTSRLSLLKGWV
jgi:hypothetical protein